MPLSHFSIANPQLTQDINQDRRSGHCSQPSTRQPSLLEYFKRTPLQAGQSWRSIPSLNHGLGAPWTQHHHLKKPIFYFCVT